MPAWLWRDRCHHRRGRTDRAAAVIGGESLRSCWCRFLSWPPYQSQPSTTSIGHRKLLLPSLRAPSNHRCPITRADFRVRSNPSRAECHAPEELDGNRGSFHPIPPRQTSRPFASRLFYRPQSISEAKATGRGNDVRTIQDFQKQADRFLSVRRAPLDVLSKSRLSLAHGIDKQFFIGYAGELRGDVHAHSIPWAAAVLWLSHFHSSTRARIGSLRSGIDGNLTKR